MKIFKATIQAANSCYVETLLVIAEDKEKAHLQLCEHEKRQVIYVRQLQELTLDLTKPNVIPYVGWGHNEDSRYGDD